MLATSLLNLWLWWGLLPPPRYVPPPRYGIFPGEVAKDVSRIPLLPDPKKDRK